MAADAVRDGLLCRLMFEYSSVSASSYDPGALVAKLNEAAADGWDVVAIVPTGGDVSAFLRAGRRRGDRRGRATPTGETDLVGATVAEEVAVEEPETAAAGEGWAGGEVAAADAALTDAGAEATDGRGLRHGRDRRRRGDRGARRRGRGRRGRSRREAAAVDEPAGWAVAPVVGQTTPPPRPTRSRSSPPEPRPRQPSPWRPSRAARSGAGARTGTGPRAGTRRHDAGRLVPRSLGPLRAALLGRHQWTEHVARRASSSPTRPSPERSPRHHGLPPGELPGR